MKGQATVLVVEDNDVIRKVVRVALQGAGYNVLEAADARSALDLTCERAPDLILQDMILPDMNGFDLVRELRRQPGGAEVPILAFTGFVSRLEEAQTSAAGFTDLLVKPVEPSRLVQTVRAYLASPVSIPETSNRGRHILVADDDPVQLKLLRIRLSSMGFKVAVAADGQEALDLARRILPDAVMSDVLMPRLDGFKLALAIRNSPKLSRIPVILTSSFYIEKEDREFARKIGANALVLRTPDLQEAIQALRSGLEAKEMPVAAGSEELLETEYVHRLFRQVERQATMNANLSQRCALQAAEINILLGISEALTGSGDVSKILGESFAYCLDATGISSGALFLFSPKEGFELIAAGGFSSGAARDFGRLLRQDERLMEAIRREAAVVVPSESVPSGTSAIILERIQAGNVLIVPIKSRGDLDGALMLASKDRNLKEADWLRFAQTVAAQVGQGVALSRAFSQVAASEQRYRTLCESSVDGIAIIDIEARAFRHANSAMCRMLGYTDEELRALKVDDIHPTDALPGILAGFEAAVREDKIKASSVPFLTKEGTVILMDIRGKTLTMDGRACIVGVFRDVTERNLLEAQFRHAQKMEAVGRLAGGVAHDFNNLLTAILGLAELSMMELPEGHRVRKDLEEVKQIAKRAAQLTHQLLVFSRKELVQPLPLDLNRLIAQSSNMLRRIIGEDVELEIAAAPDLWTVKTDPGQIEQAIVNLCVNARDAMPKGGRLTVTTANTSMDEATGCAKHGLPPGEYALIAIADTGVGMTEEVKAHLFEPFFTTKEQGKGTGLGLSTCYGIVKQGGGCIAVESEPGRGSTFKIYLPRVQAKAEPISKPSGMIEVPRGSETILLVEDESAVRNLASRILQGQGYTVVEAADGQEALAVLEEDGQKNISLVLTDVVMPKLGGKLFADELRLRRPDIKIIFTSGYTDEAISHQGILDPAINFIGKPFAPAELARKVRAVLDWK